MVLKAKVFSFFNFFFKMLRLLMNYSKFRF